MTVIHRNTIVDLLPAYLSGEASAETKTLIEEFAKTDSQIARLIASGGNGIPKVEVPETELRTLLRTRRRIRKQSWHLGLAIFFTLLIFSYQWDSETGIAWTWDFSPAVAVIFAGIAAFFWIAYFDVRRKLKQATGL